MFRRAASHNHLALLEESMRSALSSEALVSQNLQNLGNPSFSNYADESVEGLNEIISLFVAHGKALERKNVASGENLVQIARIRATLDNWKRTEVTISTLEAKLLDAEAKIEEAELDLRRSVSLAMKASVVSKAEDKFDRAREEKQKIEQELHNLRSKAGETELQRQTSTLKAILTPILDDLTSNLKNLQKVAEVADEMLEKSKHLDLKQDSTLSNLTDFIGVIEEQME